MPVSEIAVYIHVVGGAETRSQLPRKKTLPLPIPPRVGASHYVERWSPVYPSLPALQSPIYSPLPLITGVYKTRAGCVLIKNALRCFSDTGVVGLVIRQRVLCQSLVSWHQSKQNRVVLHRTWLTVAGRFRRELADSLTEHTAKERLVP